MKQLDNTIGFGAPENYGAHIFMVKVPAVRNRPVSITEVYGYAGEERDDSYR